MSSIYKKGRDGYYYYQTYIYNSKSRKKDKRVFHALGTKDFEVAKDKQKKLDLKYDKQRNNNLHKIKKNQFPKIKAGAFVIFMVFITVYLSKYYDQSEITKKTNTIHDFRGYEQNENKDNNINIIDSQNVISNLLPPNKSITEKGKELLVAQGQEVAIPSFTIERIERLSGSFQQGKLYVSVDSESSKTSQNLLCKELKQRFSEFSNIVICLYADNEKGKNLAMGNDKNVSIEQQKLFWLAMYTYNPVEGEYFDDNPSSYLGVN
tara:strand:+ start:11161 stop:11952 length:792 start_codon:yes stop_codon:yes gene_type:complete